ncbi:acyl-CoA dehydrogenase [Ahrensia sp. R2A130]|uniref:acyl-CoA dehydrogenase n=1 Tax=Ahrensia sp. R2A130 TaxID=744979 RepID=UPI0001E0D105|nr:acyl-CoA dehydrogenase [Ahrensia sp. R2A130]EFL88850.1 acyl-CoA dehydrogenase [Ahrensia sp. R2A130]
MYRAPVDEIVHTLKNVTGLGSQIEAGEAGDLSEDLLAAIVEEGARFAGDEIAPLSRAGDEQGAHVKDGVVSLPDGWADLYRNWAEGGWNALSGPEGFGGQGLPMSLQIAAFEMWNSGSLAFAIGPTLTIGAIEAIDAHASDELKAIYLEKLVSGEWTGTMNLTEPQAGSDLNALKSRAEPVGDGSYRVFGQKIYITYGEHEMTDNIVHLVLARLPDAPAGQRGVSLFLVPKVLEDGTRNDVYCHSVEHKLGIHASPTCTMLYGDGKFGDEPGAIGWLIGEENRGLACMFTMMNNARIMVAIQGTAVAEAATQKALAYAQERRQGKAEGFDGEGMAPIIHHPDVQRNIATMRALTNASRTIAYNCAHAIARADELNHASARNGGEPTPEMPFWQNRAALLTPVAKAFATDIGCEVASIGVQVHGGMGFVEETGAAQLLRDARIAPIYEGTNGIQAIDLVTRKLPLDGGEHVRGYIGELRDMIEEVRGSNRADLNGVADALSEGLDDLLAATEWLLDRMAAGEKSSALSGATPYLRLFALASGSTYLAASAVRSEDADIAERAAIARFAALDILTTTSSLRRSIEGGSAALLAAGQFLKSA